MNSLNASPDPRITVLAVVGPTGVGKTALAEELAARHHGEIVSADSMQVYRGMDIGTAKPPAAERRVPYHCIDLVEPGEPFSAALYQHHARGAIDSCRRRSRMPVLCGGTGLYLRAAIDPMEFPQGDSVHDERRHAIEALAEKLGPLGLHALLEQKDPASAALIHPNNTKRVVRALEMAEQGVSYAVQHEGFRVRESIYDARIVGLDMDRERLYGRIRHRVDAMIAAGLVDEVVALLDAGFRSALTAAQAIGYKELVDVVDGTATLEDATEAIKVASTRYAKRQLTWFRADPRVSWIDVTELSLEEQAEAAAEALHSD